MTQWQKRSRRKSTGGILRTNKKRKVYMRGRDYLPTRLGERTVKTIKVRGGNEKRALLRTNKTNLVDFDGKSQVVEIEEVIENPADPHFVRRNIMTKGAIIKTSKGKARVTNRPGQEGTVNSRLIKE